MFLPYYTLGHLNMSPLPLEQELDALKTTSPPLIKASYHPTLPLTIYNYTNQAQWNKHWGILTMMCRGLVLEQGTSKTVARPMKKFFNHFEQLHETPDTDPFTVLEKADGSLGIWFCYNGQWMMATRGSFNSPQATEGQRLAVKAGLDTRCDPQQTYCFEIVYPENRLVVDYKDRRDLLLLAVINNDTGYDMPNAMLPSVATTLGVSMVEQFNASEAAIEKVLEMDALNQEGVVIRFDTTGERLKIKFATYMRMVKSGMSGAAGSQVAPSAASVKELVVNLLIRHPDKRIEDHLDIIPDEFYDDAKAAQAEYLDAYQKNATGFDSAIERYRDTPFREIDASIPGHSLICNYLGALRRDSVDEAALQKIRNNYVVSVSANSMGCYPKGKGKRR